MRDATAPQNETVATVMVATVGLLSIRQASDTIMRGGDCDRQPDRR